MLLALVLVAAWWLAPGLFMGRGKGICGIKVVYEPPVRGVELVGSGLVRPAPSGAELAVACQEPGQLRYQVGAEARQQDLSRGVLRRGEVVVVNLH